MQKKRVFVVYVNIPPKEPLQRRLSKWMDQMTRSVDVSHFLFPATLSLLNRFTYEMAMVIKLEGASAHNNVDCLPSTLM